MSAELTATERAALRSGPSADCARALWRMLHGGAPFRPCESWVEQDRLVGPLEPVAPRTPPVGPRLPSILPTFQASPIDSVAWRPR